MSSQQHLLDTGMYWPEAWAQQAHLLIIVWDVFVFAKALTPRRPILEWDPDRMGHLSQPDLLHVHGARS